MKKTTLTLEIVHIDKDDESTWPPIMTNILLLSQSRQLKHQWSNREMIPSKSQFLKILKQHRGAKAWCLEPSIPTPSEEKKGA